MIPLRRAFPLAAGVGSFLIGLCSGCASPSAGGGKKIHGRDMGFVNKAIEMPDGTMRKYVVFVPQAYTPDKKWPAIVFLHGAGERGDDNKGQVHIGIGLAIRQGEASWPFITVMPQCAREKWWTDASEKDYVLATLAKTQTQYNIDTDRIYLTGLSMGGYGTWALAVDRPDLWAAIVPICGVGEPAKAQRIVHLPCWCFHNSGDPTVPVKGSREMIDALKKHGGKPRYTEYPSKWHNSWDDAYGTDELYTWLLSHRRK